MLDAGSDRPPPSLAERTRHTRRLALTSLALVSVALLLWLARVDAPRIAADTPPPAAPPTATASGATPVAPSGAAAAAAPVADGALETVPWTVAFAHPTVALKRALLGPPRVGVQVGHLDAAAHPDELARLRVSTGGLANGVAEVDVNRAVADALARRLRRTGVRVDVLPATLPPDYRADLLLSVHADASPDPARRGYKSAHFDPPRNRREPRLKQLIDDAYLTSAPLPDDDRNVSGNMLHYYAFNPRFRHAAHPGTPAVLVELGYISNRADLAFLHDPERPAAALAEGVLAFLRERDRLPPAAPTPIAGETAGGAGGR